MIVNGFEETFEFFMLFYLFQLSAKIHVYLQEAVSGGSVLGQLDLVERLVKERLVVVDILDPD